MPETPEEKKKREEEEKKKLESQDPGLESGTEGDDPPAFEFKDPALKGKSGEEIEALLKMSQQVVSGQKRKVSDLEGKVRELETRPITPATPEKKEDFFTDPDGAMSRLEKRLVETISPLREEIKTARQDLAAQGLEERMAAEFDDWHEVRPWIDQILEQQNFPNPNDEGLLRTLYFTAVGMRQKQGITTKPKEGVKEMPGSDIHKGPIPQHRSSPPPPPPAKPAASNEVTWEDLDETERAMCKFHKLTPSVFREWQNANAEDVAESTIGIETKGA